MMGNVLMAREASIVNGVIIRLRKRWLKFWIGYLKFDNSSATSYSDEFLKTIIAFFFIVI